MQKVISKKEIEKIVSNKNVLNESSIRLKELKELKEGLQTLNEASWGERLKYLAAKYLPSYKVGDKILGGSKERQRMQAEIQRLMDKEGEGFLRALNSNIEKTYKDFPNSLEKEDFLKGVLEISAVYDSIVAATKRSNNPITPEQANEYIDNLRKYVNYMMSYKLNRTIYSTMNENYNESEDIQLGEGIRNNLYVQYHSDRKDEEPFMLHGEKWQIVNAIYPDGKRDIGVYRYSEDLVYSYEWFRRNVVGDKSMGELDEATLADVDADGGLSSASVKRALARDRTARGGMSGEDEFGSEVMSGLKSNRLPLTLGAIGAVLAAAGWIGQSQWFIDYIEGLKEIDVKLTQDIIERNIKVDPRGFSYTLQNNLPAGQAVNLNFNQPVENLRKALEFYGNGDLRQGVNATSLFVDPSQRAESVSNLLKQLADPSNRTVGDIFNTAENTYGRAGTLFSQYGGAKGVIAKYFVNRIIRTVIKTGAGYALGGALIAAAPVLINVGIGAMVAGALVKLMRIKGQTSSRAATLNTLLQSLRDIPNPNPVVTPPGETSPESPTGDKGGQDKGDGKEPVGQGDGEKPVDQGDGEGKAGEPLPKPINNLMNVLRNLFIDVDKVREASKIKNEEANKRTNYLKRGGLDYTAIDKDNKQIFIGNMKRMLAVIKAVNALNINKKSYPGLDELLGYVTNNKAYIVFSNINNLIDQYSKTQPELFVQFVNAYNEAIKTTEFENLKAEIEKNLPTMLEEAKKAAAPTAAPKTGKKKTVAAAPVAEPKPEYEPTQADVAKVKLKRPDRFPSTQEIVQLFKELFKLFRRVNQMAEKAGAAAPKGKPKGSQAPGSGGGDKENKLNDPSQEISEAKNKYSKKASSFIGKEIKHLKKDKGYSQERAVAAAINVAKEKGMKVGSKKKKSKA